MNPDEHPELILNAINETITFSDHSFIYQIYTADDIIIARLHILKQVFDTSFLFKQFLLKLKFIFYFNVIKMSHNTFQNYILF